MLRTESLVKEGLMKIKAGLEWALKLHLKYSIVYLKVPKSRS